MQNDYQNYIALSRYARWNGERRETWPETVNRYIQFFKEIEYPTGYLPNEDKDFLESILRPAIENLETMPSMRCLMTAGPALERDNVAAFNCSYNAATSATFFDQAMYILLCGTGFGFSVERQYVNSLPEIKTDDDNMSFIKKELLDLDPDLLPFIASNPEMRELYKDYDNFPGCEEGEISFLDVETNTIHVMDSKIGWASSYRILLVECYNQNFDVEWDVSRVRAAGERLKTFGGRASGPAPLVDLFRFTVEVFKAAHGRKLTSIECHDLTCKIAEIVVVGGVRRSALISLSNLTDDRMRRAKMGQWWDNEKQRGLANNSVCYTEEPDMGAFMEEWMALYQSKSGERGIFSRVASQMQIKKSNLFREGMREELYADGKTPDYTIPDRIRELEFGTNPCSEIILRPKQFCNLSEVVVRAEDTLQTLLAKVANATILGTLQSSLTKFRYLDPEWAENTKEEALLGVSLTGIMDHHILNGSSRKKKLEAFGVDSLEDLLSKMKRVAIETNAIWARKIGVNMSVAITCVKPSGTVSQLVDSASGIHPRYSPHYIRTVRADNKDPMTQCMKDQGIPHEPDQSKADSTTIFSFPIKAPEDAIMRDDRNALEQLNLWLIYQDHWCEHKPSITVYVKEHEWLTVGAWVWEHLDRVSGISFLPFSDHSYAQAPYQECSEQHYNIAVEAMPDIDWGLLQSYEAEDHTEGMQTLACVGGQCEI